MLKFTKDDLVIITKHVYMMHDYHWTRVRESDIGKIVKFHKYEKPRTKRLDDPDCLIFMDKLILWAHSEQLELMYNA